MNILLQQYGLNRMKLAVFVGLVVLFAAVWGTALLGGVSNAGARTRPARVAKTAPRTPSQTPRGGGGAPDKQERPTPILLPAVDVETLAVQDLFAPPGWAADGVPATRRRSLSVNPRETTPQQLRGTGVSVVLFDRGEKIATIGDQQIRPGDTLLGYRVLDIIPGGVVLSEQPVSE